MRKSPETFLFRTLPGSRPWLPFGQAPDQADRGLAEGARSVSPRRDVRRRRRPRRCGGVKTTHKLGVLSVHVLMFNTPHLG
jgi:hypothetical protein